MSQCRGTTQKGERCRREAVEGSAYCSLHAYQAERGPEPRGKETREVQEWDVDAILKTALGFALIGAIVVLGTRR